tara:strand:- start:27537 stop:28856 length:1320 start_codon:yes stop_codon:yes gene_type:complete
MFGTDGIRGIPYTNPLDKKSLIKIGSSVGKLIKFKLDQFKNGHQIFISCDTRESSFFLKENLIRGLNSENIGVIDLGILPTSSVSFFCNKYPNAFGIVITASHNSSEYNGIKIFNDKGEKLSNLDEEKINSYFQNNKIKTSRINTKLNIEYKNSDDEYIDEILKKFKANKFKKLNVVFDLSNGSSYRVTKKIFSKININAKYISMKPNGTNINNKCGVEDTRRLKKYILKNKFDLGIAFDGDADRAVFLDSNGKIIDGDKIIDFFSRKLLKKGQTLVTSIMTNNIIEKNLKKYKIKTLKTDVGDKNVYYKMIDIDSKFGAENSGHYIFSNILRTSDSNLSALMFLSLIKEKEDIVKIVNQKLNPSILKSYEIVKKKPIKKIIFIQDFINDFNLNYKNYFLNIRYSGTENKIRILIQGASFKIIKEQIDLFGKLLTQYKL